MEVALGYEGNLLVASTLLTEPTFYRTVVLVIEDNDDGSLGIVLNQVSSDRVEDHLEGWGSVAAPPGLIHIGGPVDSSVGVAVAPARIGDQQVLPGLRMVDLELANPEDFTTVRVYAGYSGWSPGQLRAEVAEGAWYVVPASPDDPFGDPSDQWFRVLRRQPGRLAMVASFPEDPNLN